MPTPITFKLNGQSAQAQVEAHTLLVDLLRDHFRLTGTHVGCDT
ncbi:MAG TPA: (2Fe-2S)-binding protein, partial [Rubrivivax sp.]|nr:(2Fe-2S)-binding protein [Rubrivivax sp.]